MKNMNKKGIIVSIVTVIVIIAAVIFGITSAKQANKSTQKTEVKTTQSTKKPEKTTDTAYTDKMTREGAVEASQRLLRAVADNKQSVKTRLSMLSKKGNNPSSYANALSQSARDQIRLIDFMNTDNRGRILTAQALLEVVQGIQANGNKNVTATKTNNYGTIVYFDKDTKTAVVPVDLYTTVQTNLNMTFVYVDGQWKFDPYNLISEISVRQADAQNQKSSSSTSTKVTQEQVQKALQQAVQQKVK